MIKLLTSPGFCLKFVNLMYCTSLALALLTEEIVYSHKYLAVNNFYEDFGVNVNKQCIYMCCRGKIKTHKKYKFRYDSNI